MFKRGSLFISGVLDGVPIMLGYLSVSFAFGIFCISNGLNTWQSTLISVFNVTSAGQLAGVGIMAAGGTLSEMAAAQFVINLRYSLMSVSFSQKADDSINLVDRFWIAFMMTDEIFAVSSSRKGNVGRVYMAGLVVTPFLGWATGTFIGALVGNILPKIITGALGIAIYGMFIAIIIPPSKKQRPVAGAVIFSVLLSSAFRYVPLLSGVPSGFTVIICATVSATVMAIFFKIDETGDSQ